MPISSVCFTEWREDKSRFVNDFKVYATKVAAAAELKPVIHDEKLEKAHDLATRQISIYEHFKLPRREDGSVAEADQLKQLTAYLHFVSRTQPIGAYTELKGDMLEMARAFVGIRPQDEDAKEFRSLLVRHPSDAMAAQFFYEVAANYERGGSDEFQESISPNFCANLCVYLEDGRHDPDGLYLLFSAMLSRA